MTNLKRLLPTAVAFAVSFAVLMCSSAQGQTAAQPSGAVQIGTIKAISGNSLTLVPDAGGEIKVEIQEGARLLRIAPGETNLKNGVAITSQELQVGDRIRVRGNASGDGKSIAAVSVIAMKKGDIAESHQKELQDWQHRGASGPVKAVSLADGTVTISVMNGGGPKDVVVKATKSTVVRRYSPESVKFQDAKVSKLDDIKPGDQLRARGTKNPEGTELAADEIVTGTFPYVKGLITAVDAANGTITVNDLTTKKPVTVKLTAESQVRRLPAQMAQFMAMRLKQQAASADAAHPPAAQPVAAAQGAPGAGQAPNGNGARQGGGDFNQMLSRIPASTIADFQKSEAVMVVTTQGGTAITLLGGVEPLLTSSSNMDFLTPWNLGSSPEGAQ